MSDEGCDNVPESEKHEFDYENTKLAFNQEVEYMLCEKKLKTMYVPLKTDIDKIILDMKQNKMNYKSYFTENCKIVMENDKLILGQLVRNFDDANTDDDVIIRQIVSLEELFDILSELHMQKPYLDETGIVKHLRNCVLMNSFIHLFWKSCEPCSTTKKYLEKFYRVMGQITLLDLDSQDGQFTNILMYIERNSNFILLRPLQSGSDKELSYELATIFADFGSPSYLHTDVFKGNLVQYNTTLKLIRSVDPPFRIPTMYGIKRNKKMDILANRAKRLLKDWMDKTGSSNWAIGAHIVQWLMNSSRVTDTYIRSRVVSGPIASPYHAMFGMLPHKHLLKMTDKKPHPSSGNEKVLIDCSICNQPVYKVFKCYFCKRVCHFYCCDRYLEQGIDAPMLINKCFSCVQNVVGGEEMILGT